MILHPQVLLDLETGENILISDDAQSKDHCWTGYGSEALWGKDVDGGAATEFWIRDAANLNERYVILQ